MQNNRAVVLWTGGKDCNLALHETKRRGYEVVRLITFAMQDAQFRAHPVIAMQKQAQALNIPYEVIPVGEPYKRSYEEALRKIKNRCQVETVVTGDIAEINGQPNWITQRSKPAGVSVFLPLWHMKREKILTKLCALGYTIIFSCVKEPWFTDEWLGRKINKETQKELAVLHKEKGVDMCGENGEYHTLVLNGPDYNKRLVIDSFIKEKDNVIMYLKIKNVTLQDKNGLSNPITLGSDVSRSD